MLLPRPNPLVIAWFDWWCRRAMRQSFYRVHLFGESPSALDCFTPTASRLFVANHSSFWDGIVLNHLLRPFGRRRLCMIDEGQVREHPFFRRIGGFSVDRSSARDGLAAVRYAADRLRETSPAALVIFPQGRIKPNDERPLAFEGGVARIVERAPPAAVVPVALRYEFWVEQRPEALVWVGDPRRFDGVPRGLVTRAIEDAVGGGLEKLKSAGLTYRCGDRIVLRGRSSISHWKDDFRRRRQTS